MNIIEEGMKSLKVGEYCQITINKKEYEIQRTK